MNAETASPSTGKDRRSLRERLERHLWRAWKEVRHGLGGTSGKQHVFVAGMQRSGTNMLMETLEWNVHTNVYHETDRRAFNEVYEMRDISTIRLLEASSKAPFFFIKSLCGLDRLGELMDAFAPAKCVWIVRDFRDSTNSAVRSFGNFVPQLQLALKGQALGRLAR
jgi:hypothetical protein